jgi:ABC-type transport system involved in cytochrome bd biosynthesis fused ATPase/permease subunit
MAEPKDPAKARFIALTLIRWMGVGLVLLGLLINAGKIAAPFILGVLLVMFGLFDAFVMPVILARKWKSKD